MASRAGFDCEVNSIEIKALKCLYNMGLNACAECVSSAASTKQWTAAFFSERFKEGKRGRIQWKKRV
jgi:hypothetical protein